MFLIKFIYSSFPGSKFDPRGSSIPSFAFVSLIIVFTTLLGNCGSLKTHFTLSLRIFDLISLIRFGVGGISGFSEIDPAGFSLNSFSKY